MSGVYDEKTVYSNLLEKTHSLICMRHLQYTSESQKI